MTGTDHRKFFSPKRRPRTNEALAELGRGVQAALETYSNVHQGSGHINTHYMEKAKC
jgi:hypothetical protein